MTPVFESKGIVYFTMSDKHLNDVVALGNEVHGENYLSIEELTQFLKRGEKNNLNCCFVAYFENEIVGFRIAFAPTNWQPDKWCTPNLWPAEPEKMGYFKCNTVSKHHRAKHIGSNLMSLSKKILKQQGAIAGICHTWMQSPGNSAYLYIKKAGGEEVNRHQEKWNLPEYHCSVCHGICLCEAAEMVVPIE